MIQKISKGQRRIENETEDAREFNRKIENLPYPVKKVFAGITLVRKIRVWTETNVEAVETSRTSTLLNYRTKCNVQRRYSGCPKKQINGEHAIACVHYNAKTVLVFKYEIFARTNEMGPSIVTWTAPNNVANVFAVASSVRMSPASKSFATLLGAVHVTIVLQKTFGMFLAMRQSSTITARFRRNFVHGTVENRWMHPRQSEIPKRQKSTRDRNVLIAIVQLLLDLSSPKIKILKWIDGCIPVKVKYQKCRNKQQIEMY